MKIDINLIQKQLFILFTAPVAMGKTQSIIDLYQNNQIKIIFVSPLRALAVEIAEKFKNEKNVFWLGQDADKNVNRIDMCLNFISKKKALLIATVEILEDEFIEVLTNEDDPVLFVFDEFHLFYTWGENFRPILHDKFLAVLNSEHPVIGLTATINEKIMERLSFDLDFYQSFWIHLNLGNQELYRKPQKIHLFKGHDKKTLERAFYRELKSKKQDEVFLMFCSYRQEVDEKVQWAKRNGFNALGCVGGEVEKFQIELKNQDKIDCIFSTLALSHGVNLPEIKKVFINYEVLDFDFWLQMIGRGGRQGSEYEVYTFDCFNQSKKDQFLNYLQIGISDWIGMEL